MRIRTKKDVVKLDQKIKDDLGIDVSKYRNEEVTDNFISMLSFTDYITKWVLYPFLASLFLYAMGFQLIDLTFIQYPIYAIIGLILFLLSGILLGMLLLVGRIKSDMGSMMQYTIEIMKSAVSDLNLLNDQITPENRKSKLSLLFKGILHIITIPMLSKIFTESIPLIGWLLARLVKRGLTLASDALKFDEAELTRELNKKPNEPNAAEDYLASASNISNMLEKTLNFSFGIALWPLRIVFGFSFLLLLLFIYLIH